MFFLKLKKYKFKINKFMGMIFKKNIIKVKIVMLIKDKFFNNINKMILL